MKSFIVSHRRILIGLCHLSTIGLSLMAAFLLRFDFSIPRAETPLLYRGLWIALLLKTLAFQFAGLDRGWWRFVGMPDVSRILLANAAGSLSLAAATRLLLGPRFPRCVYFIDSLLCLLATAGMRFVVRLYSETVVGELAKTGEKGLLIYGAGTAGRTLLREIRSNPALGYDVIGFLDDDREKRRGRLMGVPVLGGGRDAPRIVERYKNE